MDSPLNPDREPAWRFSVAPMLDCTDRHFRMLMRQISQQSLLYSEMVVAQALHHSKRRERLLDFDAEEHPLALQVGGDDPALLADATRMAADWGYDEINMNVGCPSDRVQRGTFGACLMAEPELVAQNVAAMIDAVDIPVTVKCRIGIDDQDSEAALTDFVTQVSEKGGCQRFIIHARKAWLQGLSPKENRDIPPLDYGRVKRLKQQFPHLHIGINGGIKDLDTVADMLSAGLDTVMVGRAAYQDPWLLSAVDDRLYGDASQARTRHEVVEAFLPYVEEQRAAGVPLHAMTRHILGLFNGQPGARLWRRYISENAPSKTAGVEVLRQALAFVSPEDDSGTEATKAG